MLQSHEKVFPVRLLLLSVIGVTRYAAALLSLSFREIGCCQIQQPRPRNSCCRCVVRQNYEYTLGSSHWRKGQEGKVGVLQRNRMSKFCSFVKLVISATLGFATKRVLGTLQTVYIREIMAVKRYRLSCLQSGRDRH